MQLVLHGLRVEAHVDLREREGAVQGDDVPPQVLGEGKGCVPAFLPLNSLSAVL